MPISRAPERTDIGLMPPRPRTVVVEPEIAPVPEPEPVPETAVVEVAPNNAGRAVPPKRGRPARSK